MNEERDGFATGRHEDTQQRVMNRRVEDALRAKRSIESVARLLGLASPLETAGEWTVARAREPEIRAHLSLCLHGAGRVPTTTLGMIRAVWGALLGMRVATRRRRETRVHAFEEIEGGGRSPVTVAQISEGLRVCCVPILYERLPVPEVRRTECAWDVSPSFDFINRAY